MGSIMANIMGKLVVNVLYCINNNNVTLYIYNEHYEQVEHSYK